MTCKDCLHYEACNKFIWKEMMLLESVADFVCGDYKDKSRFVELPCKVGDTVYLFAPCFDEIYHPKLKVVEAEILKVRTTATVLGLIFDVDKIGKTVFLTREEAEKALEEKREQTKII